MFENVHMVATLLGYPTLGLLFLVGLWAASQLTHDIYKIWRRFLYDRREAKIADKEWDDIRASWRAEMRKDADRNTHDNRDTDVVEYSTLTHLNHQDVYDYIKELDNDRT